MQEADPGREGTAVSVLGMNLEGGGSRGGEFGMSSVSCGNGKLRQWLIDQIDSGKYPGLVWENEEKSIFRIPWKHAGKQDYNREEDAALFKVTRTWGARGRDGGGPQRVQWVPNPDSSVSPIRAGCARPVSEGKVTARDGLVPARRAAREQQVWKGQSAGRREVSASLVISQTRGPGPDPERVAGAAPRSPKARSAGTPGYIFVCFAVSIRSFFLSSWVFPLTNCLSVSERPWVCGSPSVFVSLSMSTCFTLFSLFVSPRIFFSLIHSLSLSLAPALSRSSSLWALHDCFSLTLSQPLVIRLPLSKSLENVL